MRLNCAYQIFKALCGTSHWLGNVLQTSSMHVILTRHLMVFVIWFVASEHLTSETFCTWTIGLHLKEC